MNAAIYHLIDRSSDTTYFRSIARLHDRSDFPVSIGSLAPTGGLQDAMRTLGVRSFTLDASRRSNYPRAISRLVGLLRREERPVLHAHCFDPTLVGLIAARLARARFVFTRHHSDHNLRLGKRWHTRIDAWCARRADRVIAVSEATRTVMTAIEDVPQDRIRLVYNGMEPLPIPSRDSVAVTKRSLGIGEQHVILLLGRLHEEKGHLVFFDALQAVASRISPFVALVAGSGPYRERFEARVDLLGLREHVRFLGQRNDVAELLSLASVVAVPSLAESFGFVVLEAMSLGRPVVAAATGGIPEIVADSGAAVLTPTGDSNALGEAIAEVVSNPVKAGKMGEAGRLRAASFGFEPMMLGYESVYREVLP